MLRMRCRNHSAVLPLALTQHQLTKWYLLVTPVVVCAFLLFVPRYFLTPGVRKFAICAFKIHRLARKALDDRPRRLAGFQSATIPKR